MTKILVLYYSMYGHIEIMALPKAFGQSPQRHRIGRIETNHFFKPRLKQEWLVDNSDGSF